MTTWIPRWPRFGRRSPEPPEIEQPCVPCGEKKGVPAFSIPEPMAGPIRDDAVAHHAPGVLDAVLDNQLVVLQTRTHVAQALNASAAMVWDTIDGRRTVAELVDQLAADAGVERSALSADVRLALSQFMSLGIAAFDGGGGEHPTRTRENPLLRRSTRLLDRVEWTTVVGPVDLAAARTVIRTNSDTLGAALRSRLHAFSSAGEAPAATVSILDGGQDHPRRFRLFVDGRRVWSLASADQVVEVFGTVLNQVAISQSAEHVILHAGAVERGGEVVVIAGDSGRGKSTLTAALLRRGFGYLTDEVAAIDVETLDVLAYPKYLDLSAGSIEMLGLDRSLAADSLGKVSIAPGHLGAVATGGRLALLVLLTDPTEKTKLVESGLSSPVATLVELLIPVFAASTDEPRSLEALAAIVETIPVIRLPRVPLDEACTTVEAALDEAVASRAVHPPTE